jgi:hypothetical protein
VQCSGTGVGITSYIGAVLNLWSTDPRELGRCGLIKRPIYYRIAYSLLFNILKSVCERS